jgi:hypothetical protein
MSVFTIALSLIRPSSFFINDSLTLFPHVCLIKFKASDFRMTSLATGDGSDGKYPSNHQILKDMKLVISDDAVKET